jgi:hypothetical protein
MTFEPYYFAIVGSVLPEIVLFRMRQNLPEKKRPNFREFSPLILLLDIFVGVSIVVAYNYHHEIEDMPWMVIMHISASSSFLAKALVPHSL